jgi:putative acetyltransferase
MHIRPFRQGEEMALHAVFHSAIHSLASADYTPAQIEAWSPSTFSGELQDRWLSRMRAIQPYVVEIEGRIAAYADVQANGYIDHFFVAAEFARQGIGSALMLHLHEIIQAQRAATLSSDVSRTAQPFFRKFGFRVIEERTPVVRGIEVPNAFMRKELVANPSIEGTSNIRLRRLSAAPHVKR